MTLTAILLTYLAASAGVTAIYAVIRYSANVRREREEAELTMRLRAQVEKIMMELAQ